MNSFAQETKLAVILEPQPTSARRATTFLQRLKTFIPERIRKFLLGGELISIESSLAAPELLDRVRRGMKSMLGFGKGTVGYTIGHTVHVGWRASAFRRDGLVPVFHGRIKPDGSGSVITGRFSGGYFDRGFMWVWTGGIVLFSICFVWTVFLPLAGWALLRIADWMIGLGDMMSPGREQAVIDHLRLLSSPTNKDAV